VKVLVLSTLYPRPSQTASGIFVHRQTRALADLGVDCHVIQPVTWAPPAPTHRLRAGWRWAHEDAADTHSEFEGIPIHHPRVFFPMPSRMFPGDTWERTGTAVARYVARDRRLRSADVLFAHFLCHEGYSGVIARRMLNIPLVAIARGDDVHAWPVRWPDRVGKLRTVLCEADGLLACSAGLARDAAAWASGKCVRPVDVIYDGIDTAMFRPAASTSAKRDARALVGLPQEGKVLLCVATPIVEKGWLDLLDALAALGEAAADWRVVGIGLARGIGDLDIVAEARARGLATAVHWLGPLPAELMPEVYRAADAFVLPSHNEGLSCSVLEAMAAGLPVLATDVGGHAEILETGRNGYLIPPRDSHALVSALRDLLSSPEARARLGAAAREKAVEIGDYRANATQLVEYFERVVSARKRALL
jgi:glycosyltransferase involved in cell wall biosynthesis